MFFNIDSQNILFSTSEEENTKLKSTATIANPKLKKLEDGDYNLTSSSPAIDKATSDGNYKIDLNGNSIVGKRDIGAYEYQPE